MWTTSWKATLAFFIALALSQPVYAADKLSPTQMAAVESISEYLSDSTDRTTAYLQAIGFQPSVESKVWNDFSPIRKIESGYLSAEQAKPGQGQTFLEQLLAVVLKDFPSIQDESSLTEFLPKAPNSTIQIKYSPLPHGPPSKVTLPLAVQKHIMGLAEVIHKGAVPGLTPRVVLVQILNVDETEAYRLLRSNRNGKRAILSAFRQMGNPPRNRKVAEVAEEVQARIEAARNDQRLNEAVARYRHVDDIKYGEWFRIRDELESKLNSGDVRAKPEKLAAMRKAFKGWKVERAKIQMRFVKSGGHATAEMWEKAFYDYTRTTPGMAALWGFAIIGIGTGDYEKYYPTLAEQRSKEFLDAQVKELKPEVEKNLGRPLTTADILTLRKEISKKFGDIETMMLPAVRDHGPIPELGYRRYVESNGFDTDIETEKYYSTPAVMKAVELICPNT